MTAEEKLCLKLMSLKKRWKLFLSLNRLITGFFLGFSISFFIIITEKLFSIPFSWPLLYSIPPVVSIVFFLIEFCKKFPLRDVAFSIDEKTDLKQRLGTAVEMIEKKITSPMVTALIEDAANISDSIEPEKVISFEFPLRKVMIMVSVLILFTGLYFIPCKSFSDKDGENVKNLIKEKGRELEQFSEEIKGSFDKTGLNKELSEDIKELAKKMQSEDVTKKQALMDISSLEKHWKERQNKDMLKDILKKCLTPDMNIAGVETSEDMLKSMARKAARGNLSDKEKAEMAKKLDEALKNMKNSSLKDELQNLSKALKSGNNKEISQACEKIAQKNLEYKHNRKDMTDKICSKLQNCQKDIAREGSQKDTDMAGKGEFKESSFKDGFSQNPTEIPLKKVAASDKGRSDFSKGSTNTEQEGESVKKKPFYDRKSDSTSDKTEIFIKHYMEERVKTEQKETLVSGKTGDGKTAGSEPVIGAPSGEGGAYKPYKKVLTEYKDEAEKSLNKEKIPEGYKAVVRQYFDTVIGEQ
ncbi:MAG: hypothetical protein ABRQ38_11975 [Candidatus Eremiobacterota bacterium]